jgi:hypothetical protein
MKNNGMKSHYSLIKPCALCHAGTIGSAPEEPQSPGRIDTGANQTRMKKLALFGAMATLFFVTQPIEAAVLVTFQAGSLDVLPGQTFNVPVTCGADFTDVTSFQFSMSWDPSIIQFNSPPNSLGMGTQLGQFNLTSTGSGKLALAWDPLSAGPETYPANTTIFNINFTANPSASPGSSSPLVFNDSITLRDVSVNFGAATFSQVNGTISVVPEPAQYTLIFAGFMVVIAAWRSVKPQFPRKKFVDR